MSERSAENDAPVYNEARAWQDNYDGMFARWLEADLERVEWKRRALHAEMLLRVLRPDPQPITGTTPCVHDRALSESCDDCNPPTRVIPPEVGAS